jgi:hypothetical protein
MPNPYIIAHVANITVFCMRCDREYLLPVNEEQLRRWESGELIQNAMPNLPAPDHELFISGTCGVCWRELFGPPPSER